MHTLEVLAFDCFAAANRSLLCTLRKTSAATAALRWLAATSWLAGSRCRAYNELQQLANSYRLQQLSIVHYTPTCCMVPSCQLHVDSA